MALAETVTDERKAILTQRGCLRLPPEEMIRALQGGVLHGRIGEGTPDAADVIVDLRDAEGSFVAQSRDAASPPPNTGGLTRDASGVKIGLLPWWPFYPWWWWWWTPHWHGRGRRRRGGFRMRLDGSPDFQEVDAEIRVGMREYERPVGTNGRYELGKIQLVVGSNAAFDVTSVERVMDGEASASLLAEPALPRMDSPVGIRIIPRLFKKTKSPWVDAQLMPGAENAVTVRVMPESVQHPWYGEGHDKKYAFTFRDIGRAGNAPIVFNAKQGVRFWMQAGQTYYFEAPHVPKTHPFHFTKSNTGGKSAPQSDYRSELAHKGGLELLAFNPRVAASDWYYQCSHHEKMGGPVFIYKSDGKEVVFADNATNTHVLQDATTGKFVVVASGGEEHPHRTISDAVRHLGLEITPRFNVGTSIVGSDIGVTVAIISRNGEDEYDDHTPAVLLRDNGKLACEHVHTVADLCQWLTRDKPHDSTQMCPDKCHV